MSVATRTFEEAILRGEATGFSVGAKPLRFARLPNSIATAFAEIGDVNCYYVFETRAEARRRLKLIPPASRLGWIFSVRKVSHLRGLEASGGPQLDVRGHPFEMRGFVVDKSGVVSEWIHGGRFGWGGPAEEDKPARQPKLSLRKRIAARVRGLIF